MKSLSVLILIVLVISPVCSVAKELSVFCSGEGASKDIAIQNALRSAIEEHLGIFISAESLVQNKELIASDITTYSRGFVEKYEVIYESSTNGNYQVQLVANILPDKLEKSISRLPQLQIDGTTDFINLRLEKERFSQAGKIAQHLFDKLSAEGYIIKFDKIAYNSDTGSSQVVDFTLSATISTDDKAWEQALKLLQNLNITNTDHELQVCEANHRNACVGAAAIWDSVGVTSEIISIFRSMKPIFIVQIEDAKNQPIYFRAISLSHIIDDPFDMDPRFNILLGVPKVLYFSGRVNVDEVKHFDHTKALVMPVSKAMRILAAYPHAGDIKICELGLRGSCDGAMTKATLAHGIRKSKQNTINSQQ